MAVTAHWMFSCLLSPTRSPTFELEGVFLQRYPVLMDPDRARQLLARERQRIEQAITGLGSEDSGMVAEQDEPGDRGSENLYQNEFDAGLAESLAGTYGLSTESGEPIPDERLEALPTAELTVEEQQLRGRS